MSIHKIQEIWKDCDGDWTSFDLTQGYTHYKEDIKVMIHKAKDGSIAITTFVEGISEEQKQEAIARFKEQHPGVYMESYEGDFELPSYGKFRNAWTLKNNKVVVDEKKAMEIHLEDVRKARNVALDNLDGEQLRNMTDAAKLKELEDKKQILRDLPANVNSLDWPEILGELK